MATFITSKAVGQTINIYVTTSTGYWKYNHNGSDSSAFSNPQTVTVANANGEFTLIPCLSDGTPSGDITQLSLDSNQITSFYGTGLSALTVLSLTNNLLTSFDGTSLSALTNLGLLNNQITTFDGTGLTSLTNLDLSGNQLTSFDGTDLTSLGDLRLQSNQITSLDGFILPTSLTELTLQNNQLTSFDGAGLTSLTVLSLDNNQITSFDGTDLTSLIELILVNNLLTSIDVSPMVALFNLFLADVYGLNGNPMTATANNAILAAFVSHIGNTESTKKYIFTTGGRTSAGTADYNTLINDGYDLIGFDLTGGNGGVNIYGKLRIKGATTIG
jgi:Leucine-rich repeat (LRR) protein